MPTLALYLLKVILCSAVLFGYYHLCLRNKVYHMYNRFYLLAAVSLSLVAPIINLNILFTSGSADTGPIQMLRAVNNGDQYLEEIILYSHQNYLSTSQVLVLLYCMVSAVLLYILIKMMVQITRILKTSIVRKVNEVVYVESNAKGTPFSFFKYIFWNPAIDIHSATGQQVLAHELAHVRENHSADKLFLNIVLILCWINPIFWLIKKELNVIHEFIADKKAVDNNDASALAAMIVTSAYPQHAYLLTNHFFYSPIKRRLQMLTKNNTKKAGYVYRLLALPVILFLLAAFSIKAKVNFESTFNPASKIRVVIDAGHGGQDAGAKALDGSLEKDLALAFVKQVKALNQSDNIEIFLTRESDIYQSPKEKAELAKKLNADLFISIHAESSPSRTDTKKGMEVLVARDEFPNSQASKLFASAVIAHFNKNYGLPVAPLPVQGRMGIFVLQAVECPSILIETGYLSNSTDLAYLNSSAAKITFANNLLAAIAQYADNRNLGTSKFSSPVVNKIDTPPTKKAPLGLYKGQIIKAVEVWKDKEVVNLLLDNGKLVSLNMSEAKKQQIKLPTIKAAANDFNGVITNITINKEGRKEPLPISGDSIFFNGGKDENQKVTVTYKISDVNLPPNQQISGNEANRPLIILNGKEISYASMKAIAPTQIESINVLKSQSAIALYGATKGKNGVIEIFLKKEAPMKGAEQEQ